MGYNVGDRVVAIRCADENEVQVYGHGVYQGDFEHEGCMFPNPKIQLDSGEVVWGCECWWGSEASMKKYLDGSLRIVPVSITNIRKEIENAAGA